FVYNLALGYKFSGAVGDQAELRQVEGPGPGAVTPIERIAKPGSYSELAQTLRTGDLLFVRRNNSNEVSHVVIWIGPIGQAPDGTPLVIDSHGEGVEDVRGASIPSGIYLRPMREKSWYFREASHALRILH
ncbi:MAG TPA: hypothetical protein VG713_06470, partial [Pirellulales bacterium]|nr:hypothetical protein [Pirellulales bacterium]